MKILISGSHGLVGSALVPFLEQRGNMVHRIIRGPSSSDREVQFDFRSGSHDRARLEGFDAVVHLAGENIGEGRWTTSKKERIRESRVTGTTKLVQALLSLSNPPKTFIGASAMGYYGDRGDEVLIEESPPGNSFLAEVCREWESAATPLSEKGVRVAYLRSGLILSGQSGALHRMLLPFRLGVGGKIGSGNQYWSWIAVDDAIGVIHYLLENEAVNGPVNVCSPDPVTVSEFTTLLGKVMRRPSLFPLPSFAARIALGEMANELILASIRMKPAKLLSSGYVYLHPDLEEALYHALKHV
jgi:uncharacterized protein (TIGR01777 family)